MPLLRLAVLSRSMAGSPLFIASDGMDVFGTISCKLQLIVAACNDSTTTMALTPNPQTNPPRPPFIPAYKWTLQWEATGHSQLSQVLHKQGRLDAWVLATHDDVAVYPSIHTHSSVRFCTFRKRPLGSLVRRLLESDLKGQSIGNRDTLKEMNRREGRRERARGGERERERGEYGREIEREKREGGRVREAGREAVRGEGGRDGRTDGVREGGTESRV